MVRTTFRFRPPRPVSFVDLRGDLLDWRAAHALAPAADGWLETSLDLPVGTWAYKYRLSDGEWLLDPHNPRTRGQDGVRNSLLVVGGADEPVLHAPERPWLHVEDDGRLCLRAGLRRGAGEALRVRWDEGAGAREAALRPVADEDEHRLYEVHLPASARTLAYLFVLDDGRCVGRAGGAGQAFRVRPSELVSHAPAWWREAVLYTIVVDRFRRAGAPLPERRDARAAGGDLDGVVEALPHLVDLGVTALHLTPIALSRSAHRYDAIDPRVVDPRLGGEAALARLLDAAHAVGLRVILDVTVTHLHRDHAAFRDAAVRGPSSPYWRWFRAHRFPFGEGPDPGYAHYQKGRWDEPLLETSAPEVQDYLVGTFEYWAKAGADGFRVDAAADVPLALLERISDAVKAVNPEAVVFGEVIPDNLHRFTRGALDAATDFVAQEVLYDFLWRRRAGAARTAAVYARRRVQRGGPAHQAIAFTATHDQPRLRTLTGDARAARLGQLLVLLGPEVPALYYGDEIGLCSTEPEREFEDAWPDRRTMPWDRQRWDEETLSLVRAAIALRRRTPALARGDEQPLDVGHDDVLAFRRRHGDEVVEVYLHRGEGTVEVALAAGAPSEARTLLSAGEAAHDGARVRLGPFSALVVAREPRPEVRALLSTLPSRNRAVSDAAFLAGAVETPSLPAHLYVTVTEACNLRCAHCITGAPDKTRSGRARRLEPWVLDALDGAFASADYIGFVHGGESLTAAIFPEVLRRIRRAQAGRAVRADVHLLSNGMLLDGERVRRLIELGVTSLAVSLDGASAATNDVLRAGGRIETVLANLRAAEAARRALGADLRLGISTVVTASNATELPALGRIVAELGLDWLKLEELVPVTPRARVELIAPRAPRLEAEVATLREVLRGSKVVLVDHRDPPGGCTCHGEPDAALLGFRAADDFANRATFRPCRAAWEQACVDPDGTVRPVDYDHAPLGSLIDAELFELWNGPAARAVRAAALARLGAGHAG